MSEKRVGIILAYLTLAISTVIGFFFSPFLLRMIGDSQYGIYSLAKSLISFIAILDLGLGQTIVRYVSKARALGDNQQESKIYGFFFLVYSAIALVATIIGFILVYVYPMLCKKSMTEDEIDLFRKVFLILLINTVFSFPMCVFSSSMNAHEKFIALKATNLIFIVLKYAAMILALYVGYKLIMIAIISIIASVVMKLLYALYCKRVIRIHFSFRGYDKAWIKEVFLFSFFIFLNILIDFLYNSTDKLILGSVAGTLEVTIYEFGVFFQTYFQDLSTTMSGVYMPSIVSLYEKDKDMKAISDLFLRVGRLQMIILALALSGYCLIGKEFIQLWLGSGYDRSYYIGLLIMIPTIIPLTQNIGISVLRAMNIHKYRSYMYLAIAILNVGISIPLAKVYGGIGAAIGTAFANVCGQILFMNWFYSKKVGIDIATYWKDLIKIIGMTIVPAVLGVIIKRFYQVDSWLSLIIFAVVYSAVYFILYYFVLANTYEKGLVRGFVNKIKR